jgi:hypothetical protein
VLFSLRYGLNCYVLFRRALTVQEPSQVTSCCNLLAPVRQLSFNSRSARMSFSRVQRVFIAEHCLASRSYLTCQNKFRNTFPGCAPVKSTAYRLVNKIVICAFRMSLQKLLTGLHETQGKEWVHTSLIAWTFPTQNYNIVFFLFYNLTGLYFLTNATCHRYGLRDLSIILYNALCTSCLVKPRLALTLLAVANAKNAV